ncbi:MAG: hypothetical protein ACLTSZ_08680 [Lachnospiraceae bacterium]
MKILMRRRRQWRSLTGIATWGDPQGGLCAFKAVELRIEFVTEKTEVARLTGEFQGTGLGCRTVEGIQAMDHPTVLIGGGYARRGSLIPNGPGV